MKYIINTFFFLAGCAITALVMLLYYGHFNYEINVIDLLMLIATIALSIIVLYLSKRLENKDIIRDITISDLNDLCDIYKNNSELFDEFDTKSLAQEQLQKKIILNFHKADLLIDRIDSQFKESFPKMLNNHSESRLVTITSPYWKWVTGGELMEKNFKITPTYIKGHETQLSKVVGELKLTIHQLVKIA
jgi:hypothetical protein